MKIVLMGYMGSGKSKVGAMLAQKLKLPHIDLDHEIEKESGYSITETILNKGELYFRQLERQVLEESLHQPEFVMSTGGGTPCYFDSIDLMNKNGVTVYLQLGVNDLLERLENDKSQRPLLAHLTGDALKEFIAKHLFERRLYYEKAIFTINASNKSAEQISHEIEKLFND